MDMGKRPRSQQPPLFVPAELLLPRLAYRNRRRIRGPRGKRPWAHVGGLNLVIPMRTLFGSGTLRVLPAAFLTIWGFCMVFRTTLRSFLAGRRVQAAGPHVEARCRLAASPRA